MLRSPPATPVKSSSHSAARSSVSSQSSAAPPQCAYHEITCRRSPVAYQAVLFVAGLALVVTVGSHGSRWGCCVFLLSASPLTTSKTRVCCEQLNATERSCSRVREGRDELLVQVRCREVLESHCSERARVALTERYLDNLLQRTIYCVVETLGICFIFKRYVMSIFNTQCPGPAACSFQSPHLNHAHPHI